MRMILLVHLSLSNELQETGYGYSLCVILCREEVCLRIFVKIPAA